MSEWEETRLGEILELITDYHSNGSYETLKANVSLLDEKDFAVMIRTTNFEQNNFSENLKYITKEAYVFLKKSTVFPDDIIMNKIANAGSVYFMPDLQRPVSLAMNLFLIRVNKEKANQRFVFYYLKANEAYVKQFAEGSVTKTITKNAVRNLVIRTPSLARQNEVVKIIKGVESKIENLRRQNETLEAIAQALFKHWFVDFEFPNEDGKLYKSSGGVMEQSELGEIPEGWRVTQLGDVVNTINGYSYKGTDLGKSHTALVNLKNFDRNGGFRLDGFKEITTSNYQHRHLVEPNDLLVAHTDLTQNAEVLGNPVLVQPLPKYSYYVLSMDLVKVTSKNSKVNNFYFYYLLSSHFFKQHCIGYANGTTVLHLSKRAIPEYKFPMPIDYSTVEDFQAVASRIRKRITNNLKQIQTLTKIRDVILPQLISGKLRIIE